MNKQEILSKVDHTLLKPEATTALSPRYLPMWMSILLRISATM